jgi:hypothetical protein
MSYAFALLGKILSRLSVLLAVLCVLGGLFPLSRGDFSNFIWLVFTGLFVALIGYALRWALTARVVVD